MNADLILYALIAAGLVFWLRSILGTRDEDDDGKGIFSNMSEEDKESIIDALKETSGDKKSNVVSLGSVAAAGFILPRHIRIDNKTTENNLQEIAKKYDSFDLNHFLEGAEYAFPMIIEAFAAGDKETLKAVLSEPVYDAFSAAINARKESGETVETEVKAIEKIDILESVVKDDMLFITLKFTARETCLIRDRDGEIISGEPDRTTEMKDVWVFGRVITSDEPEWYLYETRDDEIEDHKTPVPDAGKAEKTKDKT